MFKSQKLNSLFFYFFLLVTVSVCSTVECVAKNNSLTQADSLFGQKKYTEALIIYQSLDEEGVSTPSMYLKMAYIKEALEDIPGALYFLNKYYLLSQNKIALKKMENLANKYEIEGYEYSDKEFIENLMIKYGAAISLSIVLILVLLFILIVYQRFYLNIRKTTMPVFVLIVTFFVLINSNIRLDKIYGIVKAEQSFVMSDASSGSNIIDSTKQGNRFIIKTDNDIWLKLDYSDGAGYIRKVDMMIIKENQPIILWLVDQLKSVKS